jgi:subtilisin family serine protease
MRRSIIGTGLAVLGSSLAALTLSSAAFAGSYIVVLKDSVSSPGAVAASTGEAHGFKARFVYGHALKGYAGSFSAATASAIAAQPDVAYVTPDESFHAAGCTSTEQCLPTWAERIGADQSSARSGDGEGSVNVNVAVVDSGIDARHPDLNVVGGVNCSNGKGFEDQFGHGTLVAGIIGAKDNGFGVVGVVPGANLWSVRVLNNKNVGSTSSILCGVDWVTATRTDSDPTNDIAVANVSIVGETNRVGDDGNCGYTRKDPVHQAICASVGAGVTFVVAAGNSSADLQHFRPAAYHEVLTATAIADYDGQPGGLSAPGCEEAGADDSFAIFSNFATLATDQTHTVAAPGVCVASTAIGGLYGAGSGTSFASPAIAGTVALCIYRGACAGLTPPQIVKKIVADAQAYNTLNPGYGFAGDPLRPTEGKDYGYLIRGGIY